MTDAQTLDHRGCRLRYRVTGPADGPPVLFVQGVGVHGDGWRPQVDALAGRFRCLTFDNRGMGLSQPVGNDRLTVEQMADDAAAVMDANEWASAHVVGHSLGGLVALHLALSARARVRSLSLLCTFADGRVAARLTPWILWVGTRTRLGPRRLRRRAFLKLILPPVDYAALSAADADALAEAYAPLFGHDLGDSPPVAMKQLGAAKRYDATPRLGELAGIPTTVVSAEHDRIAPPWVGRAIMAGIGDAGFIEMPNAAHGLPIHQPDRINQLFLGNTWAPMWRSDDRPATAR